MHGQLPDGRHGERDQLQLHLIRIDPSTEDPGSLGRGLSMSAVRVLKRGRLSGVQDGRTCWGRGADSGSTGDALAQRVGSMGSVFGCGRRPRRDARCFVRARSVSSSVAQELKKCDKNGRSTVTVTASLTPPETPTAQDIGCPNPAGNWEVLLVLESVTKRNAHD